MDVGQVLYLPCLSCVETGRLKYFVVALTWPEPRFFLINSDRSPFAANKPTVAQTQVPILKAEHRFLDYDSWLDCSVLKQDYSLTDIEQALANDPSILRGGISKSARILVRAAVTNNRLLPREFLGSLRNVW